MMMLLLIISIIQQHTKIFIFIQISEDSKCIFSAVPVSYVVVSQYFLSFCIW